MAMLAPAAALLIGAMPVARLDVSADDLRSAKGVLQICLTADPDKFPGCVDDANAVTRTVAAAKGGVRFDGLRPGTYAVSVIHDENGNKKLDTFAGIPREGFGFSRNPAIRFGPPKFAAARFAVAGNDAEMQQIKMRYIF
jgi:uncharacterized protein (DUF2141 family)